MLSRFINRFINRPQADHDPRGQVLVIVAAGLIIIVAMTGLVVDGGFAWGQQRDNQNAADAASEAGAVVLAERLTGLTRLDADVLAAVNGSTVDNDVVKTGAWYTNIAGSLIDALGVAVTARADAAPVGNGLIPANAAGVQAETSKDFETFLVRVIGVQTLTTVADATAVAGYVTGCPQSGDCDVLPVTVPLNIVTCDGSGDITPSVPASLWPHYNVHVTVPLCKNNPGNVGWLDWTPTAGGTSELITAIGPPTTNPGIDVPSWQYITSTGNVNSKGVEDAINYYAVHQIPVLIPMFDSTCDATPIPDINAGELICPPGHVGGHGSNQWYHIDRFVSFLFDNPKGAYINGSDKAACEQNGNGATSCLKGMFVRFVIGPATVGPGLGWGPGENSAVGVQLIE
jgi:hypothetical protein